MASAKVLHCVGAWLVEHQPDKRKTAEHLAWCRTASSLCCLGRLSEPLQQKLSYPVQRLRAKHAEDQAAEQRALCLAAKAEQIAPAHALCKIRLSAKRVCPIFAGL